MRVLMLFLVGCGGSVVAADTHCSDHQAAGVHDSQQADDDSCAYNFLWTATPDQHTYVVQISTLPEHTLAEKLTVRAQLMLNGVQAAHTGETGLEFQRGQYNLGSFSPDKSGDWTLQIFAGGAAQAAFLIRVR